MASLGPLPRFGVIGGSGVQVKGEEKPSALFGLGFRVWGVGLGALGALGFGAWGFGFGV